MASGGALALGCLWVLLDLGRVRFDRLAGRMTASRLRGLREALPLASIRSVLLVPGGVHDDREDPYETFQVNLALRGDGPPCLNLIEDIDRDRARRVAGEVAAFLGASLLDHLPPARQEKPGRPRRGGQLSRLARMCRRPDGVRRIKTSVSLTTPSPSALNHPSPTAASSKERPRSLRPATANLKQASRPSGGPSAADRPDSPATAAR